MKQWMVVALALTILAGCEEKFEPPPEDKAKAEERAEKAKAREEAAKQAPPPKEEPKEEVKPAVPDPTTPKEIAEARNVAILDGRIDDAIRLCGKEDLKTVDAQGVLGCVLAACRKKDTAKAKEWAANLDGPLKKEAVKVCAHNGVGPL